MCGLIAAVAKANNGFFAHTQNAFDDLLYMDTLRGPDSTGVFLVDRDGDVTVLKDSSPAWEFMSTKEYQDSIDKVAYKAGKVLVGHNRKATVGKIVNANAHPFTVNNEFVLVHNGSLSTTKHLGHDADVDSHSIAKYLHDKWDDNATPEEKAKVLAHIGGAWALMWYDLRSNKFNVVRNPQRPLAMAETPNEYFFASEYMMLLSGLSRNGVKAENTKDVPAYKLITFDLLAPGTKPEEVDLPTSFFTQPKPAASPGGYKATTSTPTTVVETLSKNKFKNYLKKLMGKPIAFYVEDFVATDNNDPHKWHFYGQSFTYNFQHEIVGVTNNVMAEEVMEHYNCAEGIVTNAEYDKRTKLVSITVELTGVTPFNAQNQTCH